MSSSTRLSASDFQSLIENPFPVTVALYFRSSDAAKLWDLARRHCLDADDLSMFAKAARSTERGEPIVVECIDKWQLEEVAAFFARHGIQPPTIEELRI